MIKIIILSIFSLFLPLAGFCQTAGNETITITTYYPSPSGVYETIRLYPGEQPESGSSETQIGSMFYNASDHSLYIYNGTGLGQWQKIGLGGGSGGSVSSASKVESGHEVWPDVCPGILETRIFHGGSGDGTSASICSEPWLKNITFNSTFSRTPQVFVSAEYVSGRPENNQGDDYTCGEHSTDALRAYAENVTTSGFDLRIGSSAMDGSACCHGPWGECTVGDDWKIKDYYGKGEASWLAIGE